MNGLCQAHSSCARSGTLPVPFSDLDKWLLTKGYSGTELLFKKSTNVAPHWAETLLHEAFITHTFQICCISTRDIRTTHSVWCSVPKSAELLFPLAAGEIRLFSSPHVSQCLTYIRKKNESSTNPHPNSQTFLNPKQESQACDRERYFINILVLQLLFHILFFSL